MIGICIGVGPGWVELAEEAADQMWKMTGVECDVWGPEPEPGVHPSWMKTRVWDAHGQTRTLTDEHDSVLIFDADVWCCKPWDPEKIFEMAGGNIVGVAEANTLAVLAECARFRLPWPDWYINGGLLIVGRQHRDLLDQVWSMRPQYGSWLEQTALNEVIRRTGAEVLRLPRKYNALTHGKPESARDLVENGAINIHFDSLADPELIRAARRFCGNQI